MNTVDSLKKLYKTMAGKDWPYDPNPTDAEVIDKIAADGNAGGSGGCDCGGIEIKVKYDIDAAPGDSPIIEPLSTGLSVSDFLDTTIMTYLGDNLVGFTKPFMVSMPGEGIQIMVLNPAGQSGVGPMVYTYDPATGEVGIPQVGLGDEFGHLV